MTKDEFTQLYYLNRGIMRNTEELVNLKIATKRLKNGGFDKRRVAMIKRREDDLVQRIRTASALRDKAKKFIELIDDNLTRKVFEYRYSKCMTWKQVARSIGGGNTSDGVRKIAERYLSRLKAV